MRPDGDPERDDYGLPHVHVVVPDDARELERDVLAYRREERLRRRRARMRRLLGPLTRFGIAVPLIAGALLIALISGTLMTVMGPRPTPRPTSGPVATSPGGRPGQIGGRLPAARLTVDGRLVPSIDLRPGVIGIVPLDCVCDTVVAELAKRAQQDEIKFWLAADRRRPGDSAKNALKRLRALAGAIHDGTPKVIDDQDGVLAATYAPNTKAAGLTAVLVHTDGIVAEVLLNPQPGPALGNSLSKLQQPSPTAVLGPTPRA